MAIELRLTKDDPATPWGFRLIGGANYEIPLTTIKVLENSIAKECGLKVGDVIVKINDDDITALTHAQAHDRIIQAENELIFSVVRSGVSDMLKSLIEEEVRNSNEIEESEIEDTNYEVENLLEGSVPIDYPEKTIEDLIKDEEKKLNFKNNDENLPRHDLNLTDEDIHSIISPEIVTNGSKPVGPPAKGRLEPPQILKPNTQENHITTKQITTENVKYLQSQVIEEINNNLREEATNGEKKWSTFLQKPKNAVPPSQPQFQAQKTTYRVKIRTKKDLEAERAAKQAELEAEALRQEKLAEEEAIMAEIAQKEEEEEILDDEISSDSSFTFSDSDNITESTITFTPSGTEPTISFTESLNSLEEKLEKVKEQLQVYNMELVPDALQKMLTKIASQLEKIVKVVKPQGIQNGDATDDDADYDEFTDDESSIISLDSRISTPTPSTPSYQGTEPTLTFTSYSIMSDPPSQSTPEGTEPSLTFSDEHADVAECDRTEHDVTEMQEYQEDTNAGHPQPTAEEKTNKKEKALKMEGSEPHGPLVRPIILPGGRKWCAPDDAARGAATRRHASLTDERIDATISSFYEKIDGKTVGESNCCMVPSKITQTKKINFLKYQPPPKNLDHLKNSEVYKMVHNVDSDADAGIFSRPEKVISGQDYHVNNTHESAVPPQMEP